MKTIAIFSARIPVLLLLLLSTAAAAQDAGEVGIEAVPVTEDVYMLVGKGGNIGVLVNEDHVLVIDSQYEPMFDKITASIAEFTDKPVRFLINTHWHGDHTGGNARFDAQGATIIAHRKVLDRLSSGGRVDFMDRDVPPAERPTLPDLTFEDEVTLALGSEVIHLTYVEGAHTDGDALVYLERNNVLHAGDAIFGMKFPFIDLGSGGTISGHILGVESILSVGNEETVIISGHSEPNTKAQLREYLEMVQAVTKHVSDEKRSGKDLGAVVDGSAGFMEAYSQKYGTGFIDAKTFLSFIYNSL